MKEDQLVEALLEAAREAGALTEGGHVQEGPGDDAALLCAPPGHELAWTVDDQLEGIHFERSWGWRAVGSKGAGASLSDLAATGATPLGALLSLAVPADVSAEDLLEVCRGVGLQLGRCGCPLLGGNLTRSPAGLHVSISALGAVPEGRGLRRSTAKAGDLLFVTGTLGLPRAGLLWLGAGGDPHHLGIRPGLERLLDPTPRFDIALQLVEAGQPRAACMDLSDGLASDLPRLARKSGLQAVVTSERLPAPNPELARLVGTDPLELAWVGGEDFELLLAGPPELSEVLPGQLHEIGRLEPGPPGAVLIQGPLADRQLAGFDHFSGA